MQQQQQQQQSLWHIGMWNCSACGHVNSRGAKACVASGCGASHPIGRHLPKVKSLPTGALSKVEVPVLLTTAREKLGFPLAQSVDLTQRQLDADYFR